MMLQDTIQSEQNLNKHRNHSQHRHTPVKSTTYLDKPKSANSWPIDDVQPCTSKSLDPYEVA